MVFSKTFPKTVPGSNYPQWEEIYLTVEEEKEVEEQCRRANIVIMQECLQEAKALAIRQAMNTEDVVSRVAVALFEKRASHEIFWKESKAKEKFDGKR
ncbi:hypothetical protein HYX12_03250 [Candidatus Woesearchaeota archaeon]|nr:hypothetical protein [Candidatus Woesearchaeota archaeon]